MVSQLGRLRGLQTISIIRDRCDTETLQSVRDRLLGKGASVVLTESEVEESDALKGKRIVLGLDSVFGRSGERLASQLAHNATFVNYGSLGAKDGTKFELTQQMIFWKQITFKNFRLSQSLGRVADGQFIDLLAWFGSLFDKGSLEAPTLEKVYWTGDEGKLESRLKTAIAKADSEEIGGARKQLLVFER